MVLDAIERKRINEAVDALARYNKSPFITDFLKAQPRPRISPGKYDKDELRTLIKQILLGEYRGKKKHVLRVDDLITYLDQLQKTGRQHVYLFRFPDAARDKLLARLRDLNEVKSLIGGEEELYNGGLFVWESKGGPKLALVRHESADGATESGSLVLKWIETREFWAPEGALDTLESGELNDEEETPEEQRRYVQGARESDETRRIQVSVRHEERAANLFLVDLSNGECELRIQALHGQSRVARLEQLGTYRSLVEKLFEVELVGPIVLAPAIRRTLMTREVPIVHCSAILPDGGRFTGGRGELPPVDASKLQAGVTIRFDWPQPSGGIGRVELNGRLDEVFILRPLIPEAHRLLLEQVHRWREEGLAAHTVSKKPKPAQVDANFAASPENAPDLSGLPTTKEALIAILKAPFGGTPSESRSVQPAIDRAIREYARTHAVEEPSRETLSTGDAMPVDERALAQFLGYIEEVAKSERTTYKRELTLVQKEEKWTFVLSIAAAVVALVVVMAGGVLLFTSKLAIGTITSLLGALTGGGTVLIRSYARSLKNKRELIQDRQRDSQQTLMAIQAALSISSVEERVRAMSNVASSLLSRVTGVASPP